MTVIGTRRPERRTNSSFSNSFGSGRKKNWYRGKNQGRSTRKKSVHDTQGCENRESTFRVTCSGKKKGVEERRPRAPVTKKRRVSFIWNLRRKRKDGPSSTDKKWFLRINGNHATSEDEKKHTTDQRNASLQRKNAGKVLLRRRKSSYL